LEKNTLRSEIYSPGNENARYYAGQICLQGHVQSSDGKYPVEVGEHCKQCGNKVIDACSSCEAPIRGQDLYLAFPYVRPSFCHKCGRPYPWMEERLQTAKELLSHDEKLSLEEREKLWDLLRYVMSDPKSDLTPAKKKLFEIKIAKALPARREFFLDFMAKLAAELLNPD
jgi:hypothetical protein